MTAPDVRPVGVDASGPVGQLSHIVCAVVLNTEGPVVGVCGARLRGVRQIGQFLDCVVCEDMYPGHAAGCPTCRAADAAWEGP